MDITSNPIGEFLSRVALLAGLDRRTIDRLAAKASVSDMPRGNSIFRQGDPCSALHIVMRGQVKLTLGTPAGGEKVIELLESGASFGEAALVLGKPHQVSAETVADAVLLRLPRAAILQELGSNAAFSSQVIRQLCVRLYQRTRELHGYMTLSGTQRVIAYLLNSLPDDSLAPSVTLTLPVKKGLIASRLNLTQAHFSRILHELVEAALIEVSGRNVRIHDIDRLRDYAAD